MSESEYYQTNPEFDDNYEPGLLHCDFFGFNSKKYKNSQKFLAETIKYALLYGAEKTLMTKKSSARSKCFNQLSSSIHCHSVIDGVNQEACKACENKTKAKYCVRKNEASQIVKFPSRSFFEFSLKLIMFSAVLMLKLISIQFSFFTSFLTVPVRLSFSLIMFPLQTLMGMRKVLFIRLSRMWVQIISHSTSYIYARLIGKKSIFNIGLKLSRALCWTIGVCFVLVGLLFSGFLVGGFLTRRLVEHPIQNTETLNFDYRKDSPVAFVPVKLNNHKLHLTVSLTLPESDYNRKLGMFQVRLELFSADGKVTASSSQPCMLKYKSPTIRFIETVLKTAPLIAGYQTESQVLKIKIRDFPKKYEATGYLKVALEQRAEYKSGVGIPQIYDASITVESELSKLKKIVWFWRRTIFVWISLTVFWTELLTILIFFRCYIMSQGRVKLEKDLYRNKISWLKNM